MTQIADVIVPSVFNPYVIQRAAELTDLYMGGIVETSPELDALAASGGVKIEMPFWNDLTGDDEVLSDSGSLTPAKITAGQDVAALLTRGKAWTVNDLSKALSGSDPMAAIGDLVGMFWARKFQAVLIANLKGLILDNVANNSGDMVISSFLEAGDSATAANIISGDLIIDTVATMGDAFGGLSGLAVHSVPFFNLKRLNQIDYIQDSEGNMSIPTYKGLRVIVDDTMPVRAGTTNGSVYTSAIFGNGAFGLGQGSAPTPTETARNELAGNDILINRNHYIMHPRGIRSDAATRPTNATLAQVGSHTRVYDRKNVRMAFLQTNG